jgi:phosphocarrier protein
MKQFSYTIQGMNGLHSRCAGNLVKEAQNFSSNISIEYNQRIENLKRLFAVTCLGVKQGDSVTIKIEGNDETEAAQLLESYFKQNSL